MKYLTLIILALSFSAQAQEIPKYLQDAVITVKLKSGKEYTHSANEYAVVKRGQKKLPIEQGVAEVARTKRPEPKQSKPHKHIISGELLSSRNGELSEKSTGSTVDVETKRKVGVGIMYQNNIYKDLYIGGRIDSNGGARVNIGVGF